MGWPYSVTISQAIHGELLFSEASLSEKDEVKEGKLQINMKFRFGRYINSFFVLGSDRRKVMRTYGRVWGAVKRTGLPLNPSKSEQPHKSEEVTILGLEFDKKGSLEACRE